MSVVLALTAVTLTVTTALALLPSLLHQQPTIAPMAASAMEKGPRGYVVRSQAGRWYLNGASLSSEKLRERLESDERPPGGIRFLPSSARDAGSVADDLAWLQTISPGPVRLQLEEFVP